MHLELKGFAQKVAYQIQSEYSFKGAYHGLKNIIKLENIIKSNQENKSALIHGMHSKKLENEFQNVYRKNIKQN